MEGPSLVIATEELSEFTKKVPLKVKASTPELAQKIRNKKFLKTKSWGKHLILFFEDHIFRIHFLMFGSYRIDQPRENRIPKLELEFENGTLFFYSCAIKEITKADVKDYDWSTDLMSDEWDSKEAVKKLLSSPKVYVCDALMDQKIFSGLGNIMKNEILFRLRMHPETKLGDLSEKRVKLLVKDSAQYAHQFYEWKKANILKRNWQIFRKKECPLCGKKVIKKPTGKGGRLSHFCSVHQLKA